MKVKVKAQPLLELALEIGALKLFPDRANQCQLKGGRMSPYFFNSGAFCDGRSLTLLAKAYITAAGGLGCDVVFGPAYKGIPLAAEIATTMWRMHGKNVGYAYNRKEEKNHGEGGLFVGASMKGKHVLIVDDVISDGSSKKSAIEMIRAQGGHPVGIVVAFDREEVVNEGDEYTAFEKFCTEIKIPVHAVTSAKSLMQFLHGNIPPAIQSNLPSQTKAELLLLLYAYYEQYGAKKPVTEDA